jgi:hypothetical protein
MPGVMAVVDSSLANMQYILLEEGEAVDAPSLGGSPTRFG